MRDVNRQSEAAKPNPDQQHVFDLLRHFMKQDKSLEEDPFYAIAFKATSAAAAEAAEAASIAKAAQVTLQATSAAKITPISTDAAAATSVVTNAAAKVDTIASGNGAKSSSTQVQSATPSTTHSSTEEGIIATSTI